MVNENSTSYLTLTIYDEDSALVAPDSITWKVHDKSTGTELLSATALTPAATIEITVAPEVNCILNTYHKEETRVVTVETIYNSTQRFNAVYEYSVKNLRYI